ncbi:MAG: hypothetical protein QOK37_1215 [Thermoanaerobaculia bacterium]|nr:hypothetical protein [Thermoanaerobaculia bacterium]
MRRAASALFLLLTLSCAGLGVVYEQQEQETLYFGTQKPDGSPPVTDAEWQRFLGTEITSRFPSGFTTWDAYGQWRDSRGVIERERTHVVLIVHSSLNHEDDERIAAIVALYKQKFAQEAVLRVRSDVWMPR